MPTPYRAELVDADVPQSLRIQAATGFCHQLEQRIGGADLVAAVYRGWMDANESETSILIRDTAELAVKWPRAFEAALVAGSRELGEYPDVRFEVRLG